MTPPISRSNTPPDQAPVASSSNGNAGRAPESGSANAASLDQTDLPGTQPPADRAALDRQYLSGLDRWVQKSPGAQREWVAGVIREWMQGDRSGDLIFDFEECPDRSGHVLPPRLPSDVTKLRILDFIGTELGLIELPTALERFDVDSEEPVSLPRLPDGLKLFGVRCKRPNAQGAFFPMPEEWPPQLDFLIAHCRKAVPQAIDLSNVPDRLRMLSVENLRLTVVPNLGSRLENLDLIGTQITQVPETLPDSTVSIRVDGSPIADIPATWFNHPGRTIIVSTDSMTPATLERLRFWEEGRRDGTICYNSNAAFTPNTPANSSVVEGEPGAAQFGWFLGRLCGTSEYKQTATHEDFKQRVRNLLQHIHGHQAAREACFALAPEALTNCHDRVALIFIDMEKLCRNIKMTEAIRAGEFDDRKQEVLDFCTENFRSEVVDRTAQRKALNAHDPVEVHLGLIVAMSKEFKLSAEMNTMLYSLCSDITPHEIQLLREQLTSSPFTDSAKRLYEPFFTGAARETLRALPEYSDPVFSDTVEARGAAINDTFLTFLSTSDSMQELMRRSNPESMARLEQRIADKVETKKLSLHDKLARMQAKAKKGKLSEATFDRKARDMAISHAALEEETRASKSLSMVKRFIERNQLNASLTNEVSEARQWLGEALTSPVWN